jgi:hypothetical protein
MSLAAQTLRSIIPSLALCLAIFASAGRIAAQDEPKNPGGSTVRGTVTYSDTGRPVRNAKVGLYNNEPAWTELHGVTDWRGEFVIEGIPAGRYLLLVDAPGILTPQGVKSSHLPRFAQLSLSGERDLFTEIVVNGTDSLNDVKVRAIRGGVITGRVVTHDDQPLAKAEIKLLRKENGKWLPVNFTWNSSRTQRRDLRTDPSGLYRIAGLPAGEYLVRSSEPDVDTGGSSVPDDVFSSGTWMMTYYPSATSLEEAQPVTVVEGSESTGIDIRVPDRTPHAIAGRVIGPEDQPAFYARIRIERRDELGFVDTEYEVATYAGIDGSWRIPGVPAGDYVITVFGPIKEKPQEDTHMLVVAPKRLNIRVADGDVVVPDIKLVDGAMVWGKMVLDGRSFKASEEYFPRLVRVGAGAYKSGGSYDPMSSGERYAHVGGTKVSEDGSFYISSLAAGNYRFTMSSITRKKFYLKSLTRKGVDLMQAAIRLKDDTVIDNVLVSLGSDFASVEGELSVSEGQSKPFFRDAVVVLAPANEGTRQIERELHTTEADAAGKFKLTCAPGEYFVVALTLAQLKKMPPITDEYFKNDTRKFTRIKVRGAEKLTGLKIPIGTN